MVRREARILVGGDSAILEATDDALELLGLTLEEFRRLPPGGLSLDEDRAATTGFEDAWAKAGRKPIVGAGRIRLLDGRLLRLRYLITPLADGTFELILEEADEPVNEPARMYTIGGVLSAWREAERKLEKVVPGSHEWARVQADIEYFRAEYQRASGRATEQKA